ncbi:UvrD-helicase domain-containing protein [Glaciimonas immobilis]|uniref:DNA 3'-5' helicase n=1 Tax=Glaciimonas immobilis TaxID=728004 RepID=A0A840RJT7_9BURK|nr:ATP-dependent helicase [Glaciimonas immobilis]KAF3999031.1 ATP-dependent helicase [Glaciimonas immobilis]MBB5198457.1 DNA helicase-2/ATP-dependent DNA helicase PcrA [Glaciimonas immobilis]
MSEFTPTAEQVLAIDYLGHMVVTACPGSGKTEVISRKIRTLTASLPSYKGVIAISFTNKASDELRDRCKAGNLDVKGSFFGTIDKFCIGRIILPFIKHMVIISNSLEISVSRFADLSSSQQALFPDFESRLPLKTSDTAEIIGAIYHLLQDGIILLEAVGILAVHVLNTSLSCQRYIKSAYTHVFIDEYQDSGEAQHGLFLKLRDLGLIAVAVGDGDQSIYRFTGKFPEFLAELSASRSGFEAFTISVNHRCHPSIANYANRLLSQDHPLLPSTEVAIIRRHLPGSQIEIASWIANQLNATKARYQVINNRDVGILVRSENTAKLISQNIGIPHRVFFSNPFTNSTSLSSRIIESLLTYRFNTRLTAQSLISEFSPLEFTVDVRNALRIAIQLCRLCSQDEFESSTLPVILALTGKPPSEESITLLRQVFESTTHLASFAPIADNEVQILTLHKSKGLEFKIVFHLDLYDWILPRRIVLEGNWDVHYHDEQQCLNLHYVGITRARKFCCLVTSSKRFNSYNQVKNGAPSQFFARPGLDNLFG